MRQKPAALLAFSLLLEGAAIAATATGSFQVSVTIEATCTISGATALNFGTAGVLNANIDETSTITVECTNTTPYDIGLNEGLNGSSVTTREMVGGPSSESIQYALYSNAARTTSWGNTVGTDTVAATGTGAAQNFTVYGRIAPQTTPTPGSYTDTITITVTY